MGYNSEKLTKLPETRTSCETYHNKAMYQVSVVYVKGFEKKAGNTTGGTDGQIESKPIVLSSETVGD